MTFELGPDTLSYIGPEMRRIVEPGVFDVMVGGNSRDVKSATLEVHPM